MFKPRLFAVFFMLVASFAPSSYAGDLDVLFLGDNGHHQPKQRFDELQPVLQTKGIRLVYTDNPNDLNPQTLGKYDALVLYANIDRIEPSQERALLGYVEQGGGFVPLHCATYCFRNSPEVVALMGAQFQRHGTGVFRAQPADREHPILSGYGGFESWDETYAHHLHNEKNRTVLEYRVDESGREPWTWVRTHGDGRVFYTAWGHDHRTWTNPGFLNLVERGIRWAAKDDVSQAGAYLADRPFPVPEMTPLPDSDAVFEYTNVGPQIPNYTPSAKWGTQGEPLNLMQKPLPPEHSQRRMSVPQGFRVELFAAEPDLQGKPICMAWDERGRLWVAETYDYPNELQPEGKGRDRIRICEDTDGDWRADRFTTFAENLSIPTSIAFHRGGVIVQNGMETLYLKDTDGDDRADERRVIFSGWQLGDTHGGVSNFQYGLDNWIWAMQGYNNSEPVVRGEKTQRFRMGFFRFRPDGSELEFIRSTDNNTWGLGISEEGLVFGSTANRNPSVFMPIANRYYEKVRGWTRSLTLGSIADTHLFDPVTDKIRQVDQHGGYTAGAGHSIYTARQYPSEYWNRTAFVNGPTGHLVGTFVLGPQGAGFTSTSPFNLLASDDEWTAPIMAEVGPDGSVWALDWYNFIVQHNPTPHGFETGKGNAYVSKLRDKKHGRIYRVVHQRSQGAEPFSLAGASVDKLLATLEHPNMLWRRHAQRLLVERGKQDVLPKLIDLTTDTAMDEIGLNVGAIHAMWTLHGLGALDGANQQATEAVVQALSHPSAGVRRNALAVLPKIELSTAAVIESGALLDVHPQVRLAAFLALADLPAINAAGAAIISAMANPQNQNDRWLSDAATSAAANQAESFLASLPNASDLEPLIDIVSVVSEHYARSEPGDTITSLLPHLADSHPSIAGSAISGLARGWPADQKVKLTPESEAELGRLRERLDSAGQGLLIKLAINWGSEKFRQYAKEIASELLARLDDDDLSDRQRIEAAHQLIEFQPTEVEAVSQLLRRVSPQSPAAVSTGVIDAMKLSESPKMGEMLLQRFPSLTPSARNAAIATLLSRKESTKAFLAGAREGAVRLSELSLDQKQALSDHPDREIRAGARRLLARGGALPNADRQKVLEDLMPVVKQEGNAAPGKELFKKHCSKCHLHSGEGHRVGPDLTGMAVHPKEELLTHIIDPSRSVEGNFRVYTVVMLDGRVLNGMLASESKTAIELFDVEGKKKTVLREDIEELIGSSKSIMPEGFEKQVKPNELADLLAFLTKRGKYVPIDLRKSATIASDRGMFFRKEADAERLIFSDWSPKTFNGVPFVLTDPQGGKVPNVILLHSPNGGLSSTMPKSASVPCNGPARAIHLLSGVSGWGYPYAQEQSVSMIVRLHYADGATEDHELLNGVHFADYIRRVDVPKSEFAYSLRGQQIRYLAVHPQQAKEIDHIEFVKGSDRTAPVVMAVTVESPSKKES